MKYRIEKWQGLCPSWIVSRSDSGGMIGFCSFNNALEYVVWAVKQPQPAPRQHSCIKCQRQCPDTFSYCDDCWHNLQAEVASFALLALSRKKK